MEIYRQIATRFGPEMAPLGGRGGGGEGESGVFREKRGHHNVPFCSSVYSYRALYLESKKKRENMWQRV